MESSLLQRSADHIARNSGLCNDSASVTTPLLEPQREQLTFNITTEGLPPESLALLEHIKQVAENVLYHWKTFPVALPPPLAVQADVSPRTGGTKNSTKPLILRDAFVPPSFDELDAVAVDSKGDPKQLDATHLSSIRKTGRFSVPSLHFPQQEHVWQLASWLQRGKHNIRETLLDDMAASAAIIVVLAKRRVTGKNFSLWHAAYSVAHGLYMILDLVVGVPWLSSDHLPARLQEERSSHLVQELSAIDTSVEGVCGWLSEEVRRVAVEKGPLGRNKQPPLPYVFVTPQGQQIDLRLYNRFDSGEDRPPTHLRWGGKDVVLTQDALRLLAAMAPLRRYSLGLADQLSL
ncbi:uncharacterized protein LOC108668684 [Hyalella azteca]|uniref:Uncharacterized protein LOC108668684 n=1 Tax=Hyalella azteca TaxID=294128 RepID=A0A8B7ND05_HYAAZ|nr:uncharacterized protein LOC108668684 [Hyalella azteca]